MEETNKRYRCWKCQQDLSRSVYYRHLRTNGCSSWRIPKKKSKPEIESDTVLVSQSQKQSNDIRASVDMEECIDIEKMNCSSEFCNDEPSTDSLLDSGNVTSTVVDHENESDVQETEVVLDSDLAVLKVLSLMVGMFLLMPYVCFLITISLSFMYQTEECSYFFLS